jgi:hypothetical protein
VRRTSATLVALSLLGIGAPALVASPALAVEETDPATTGRWSAPFEEPDGNCEDVEGDETCKPAAGTIGMLPNGKVVYWDALDSMEDVEYGAGFEFGDKARNDMVRVLDVETRTFTSSDPNPASNPDGRDGEYLPGGLYNNDEKRNDGDLFCSDQIFLADGRVLDVGGTQYYQEPGIPGQPTYGFVELEGLKNARIYDPQEGEGGTWSATGEMTYGRWYPSVVTLSDNTVLALSGVTKLIKPVYPERPGDSGRNVVQSEVYDPASGTWTVDGGNKSLPLYPRVRLLPNGNVYYDAGGQTFNPSGQAYDEALWNMAAVYDPDEATWRDLGLPEFGNGLQGFRGSAFSQMLPLRPNEETGAYDTAQFLSAGGVYGVTPGTYVGTDTSTLNTVTIDGDSEAFSSENTGSLNNPRWYSTGVSLPTGEVIAFSGADRDEVVAPGYGTPVTTPEIYDPQTKEWTELAGATKGRTYHNSATLLIDGTVLVGGHAPIATGYGKPDPTLQNTLGFSDPFRDPSFEIFEPPNLFYGPRPVIETVADPGFKRGDEVTITTPDAEDVSSVVLVRNTAMTHLVDSDQRTVELPVVRAQGNALTVEVPDNGAVLPDGPYMLFLNEEYEQGETPSVGRQVFVSADGIVPPDFADDVNANNAAAAAAEADSADADAATAGSGPVANRAAGQETAAAAANGAAEERASTAASESAVASARIVPAAARDLLPRTGVPAVPVLIASLLLGSAVLSRRWLLRT